MKDPFYAIGDPGRRQILLLLAGTSMSINTIANNFEMSRPAVSKHIKILADAGFIGITDVGRERHCHLKQEGFAALQKWIQFFDAFWLDKLSNLERLMNGEAG